MAINQSNLKFTEKLKKRTETNYIIIHHTEVRGRHDVNEVHQWHLNKGWAGIGYHYYIDKDGQAPMRHFGWRCGYTRPSQLQPQQKLPWQKLPHERAT